MTDHRPTVLITGATAGIGHAAALDLASKGWRVFATGRSAASRENQKIENIEWLALDVTKAASIDALKTEVDRRTSGRGIDVLVNNAGFAIGGPSELVTHEDLQAQLDVNVLGLMAMTRAFVPAMRRRGLGRVVNVGSLAGRYSFPFLGTYSATKHMVKALTNVLRVELQPFGVRVVLVEPGTVNTEFSDRTMASAQKYRGADSPYAPLLAKADEMRAMSDKTAVEVGDAVKLVTRAVTARRAPAYVSGPWSMALTMSFLAWLPARVSDWLVRRISGFDAAVAAAPVLVASSQETK